MKYLAIFSVSAIVLSCFVLNSEALQCYVCSQCSGSVIGTLTNCSATDNFCKTVYASALGIGTATKSCEQTCTEVNTGSIIGTGGGTKCCNTDGCNASNISIQMKSGFLILVLSTLIAFFFNIIF